MNICLFRISPAGLFRPCASSPSTTATSCSLDVPRDASADSKSEHFVLKQLMDSYRIGFPSPGSTTHHGVSEYVTKLGSAITDVTSETPAAFCDAHS
jgi:hypothetical protein